MPSLKPQTPIDAATVRVIRDLHATATARDIPFMLIGATARDILLQNVYGVKPRRTTRDIDFAIMLPTWDEFSVLSNSLISTGRFRKSRETHRLLYRHGDQLETIVDLIPFGGLEHPTGSISWPPDMGVAMNVSSCADVFAAAATVEIAPDLETKVASLAGIALLKLFAWTDRGADDSKDAVDLRDLLRHYCDAGNLDRVYEEAAEMLAALDYQPTLAGMWLLGRDAARIASADKRDHVLRILRDERTANILVTDMIRGHRWDEDSFEEARTHLTTFRQGFESVS